MYILLLTVQISRLSVYKPVDHGWSGYEGPLYYGKLERNPVGLVSVLLKCIGHSLACERKDPLERSVYFSTNLLISGIY